MTEEVQNTQEEPNVQITVEQICAAIIAHVGSIRLPLETLVANYSDKSIAVNQDETTKAVTFSLVDQPVSEVVVEEVEEVDADTASE